MSFHRLTSITTTDQAGNMTELIDHVRGGGYPPSRAIINLNYQIFTDPAPLLPLTKTIPINLIKINLTSQINLRDLILHKADAYGDS